LTHVSSRASPCRANDLSAERQCRSRRCWIACDKEARTCVVSASRLLRAVASHRVRSVRPRTSEVGSAVVEPDGRPDSAQPGLAGGSHSSGYLKWSRSMQKYWMEPQSPSARVQRLVRIAANIVGAAGAALFARASLQSYQQTHRLVGAVFLFEQAWVVVAYLGRRPARVVSRRWSDWLLAFGGTFGAVLLRPSGALPHWGFELGLAIQLLGLGICVLSFLTLGRSFGFAAADRGLVRRGPYAVVRHPIYASYLLLEAGYLLQSISVWNGLVMIFVTSCNVGRALAEDRTLATNEQYDTYRDQVRWRLVPGLW
jgi:protein-S-isoprenylcysteine O-methyltransferase Ste14